MLAATVVPLKPTGKSAANRVVTFERERERESGRDEARISVKSDSGPAIVDLVEGVGGVRASRGAQPMIVENSAAHAGASSDVVERREAPVHEHVRALWRHVQKALGRTMPVGHAIWLWLVERSGFLLIGGRGA